MGNSPDVRVRLSAEGQIEVINAFKKIQAEANKTGQVGAKGLSGLSSAVSSLSRLLPALTFGAAIAGAVALSKRSLETGDQFAKLSQKTGIAVESLSAYAHGAELAGIDTETLAKGLAKLAKSAAASAQDTADLKDPFRALGIEVKNQQGGLRSLDDLLGDVADRFSKMEDGTRKAALAQQIFGKAGANLIPFLNEGRAGLEEIRKESERLGLVWSTEAAQAAEQFNDNLKRLQGTVQGFVNRELAALLPLLNATAEALLQIDVNSGLAAESLTARFTRSLLFMRAQLSTALVNLGKAPLSIADFHAQVEAETEQLEKLFGLGPKAPAKEAPKPKAGTEPPLVDEAARTRGLNALKQLADAELAAERARLENEAALLRAHNAVVEAEDQQRFKMGLTALDDYYRARRAMTEAENAKEIALLEEQVEALSGQILRTVARPLAPKEEQASKDAEVEKLITERAKVETAIEIKKIELQKDQIVLTGEQTEAVRKLNVEQFQAEAAIAEAQGRRFDAARANLDGQIAGLQRLAGETDEAFVGRKQALFDAGETAIQFDQLQAKARLVFADIESGRRSMEALVARGILTQREGIEQIALIEKERLPVLEQIAAEMDAIAVTPEQMASVRELNDATVELAASSDLVGQRWAEALSTFESGLTQSFFDFFTRGIAEAHSLGDAFRSLAASIIGALQQVVAQMLATIVVAQIMKAVIGLASAGVGAASGTITTSSTGGGGVSPLAGATGGLVHGPGTGTSDSIPARLSHGEYISTAATVRGLGPRVFDALPAVARSPVAAEELREWIQSFEVSRVRPLGSMRSYAQGGLVADVTPAERGPARFQGELALDEALIVKRLGASREFERLIVRTVGDNRKGVNAALRR